jgi:hypothetical protein
MSSTTTETSRSRPKAAYTFAALALGFYLFGVIGDAQTRIETYKYRPGGRTGAICMDRWKSEATGRGACSWHGGVAYWTYYETEYREVRDTFLAEHENIFWKLGHVNVLAGVGALFLSTSSNERRRVLGSNAQPGAYSTRYLYPPGQASARSAETPQRSKKSPAGYRKCRRCSGHMVKRHRRSDGHAFWGCSRFPKCRYTENL